MDTEPLDDAVFYSKSVYLRVMIVIRVKLACIALVLLAVLHANRKKFVAHRSLSVLLNCHFFWVCLMCVSVIVDHLNVAYILIAKSPIHLINSDFACLVKILPKCIGIYGSICSLFMMSLERYTSSTSLSTYETSHKFYGHKLAAGHMMMIVLLTTAFTVMYGNDNNQTAYCKTTSPKGKVHNPICAIFLAFLEAWTIVVFTRLLGKNERRLKSTTPFTLTEKYQITENVRMIRIMLPVVWSHVLITTAAIIIFFIVLSHSRFMESKNKLSLRTRSISSFYRASVCRCSFCDNSGEKLLDARRAKAVMETNTATGEQLNAAYTVVLQAAWNSADVNFIEASRDNIEFRSI
ncbi:hypothetical protein PRIPAC_81685 [Pristionchus pacificus]|uniref:G protein-coupled receptor n=1 Tax=Pristionchus pacificus TaxID=54126 RepID=A0A2A6CNF1_PRIPA|nr:hypothetical protein PRIPAC_81685 [Pristionchus pacificus]|eukprot:PDM79628.1 G protein-coupled receptor [Pristionchus pacificus]